MAIPRALSVVVKDYLNTCPLSDEDRQRLLAFAHNILSDANQGWPSIADPDADTSQIDLDL